jgi:hypothetical protein
MNRHATAEELASLALGALRPRRAAKISAHLAGCDQCTQVNSQLTAIPPTLASVQYPAMPAHLSVRIEAALATESVQRLSTAPPTEAGRRDLPRRSRHGRPGRSGWQLPGMSVGATRLVASAGAIAIIAGGGYELASHVGGSGAQSASSSGAVALPRSQASNLSLGPSVSYGHAGSTKTVPTVHAGTNFVPSKLGLQTVAAVQAARLRGAVGTQKASNAPARPAGTTSAGASGVASSSLTGCINALAPGQSVVLVELAKFEGKPATIIVTAATSSRSAEVWVVNDSCSASHTDVLDHLKLARI